MIIGLGTDLVQIKRIESVWQRFGQRFIARCFTEHEAKLCLSRANAAGALAMRFAAKEACAKALGVGLRGLGWREMELRNDENGKPYMRLYGRSRARMRALGATHSHVSISDDGAYAAAVVIMEKN